MVLGHDFPPEDGDGRNQEIAWAGSLNPRSRSILLRDRIEVPTRYRYINKQQDPFCRFHSLVMQKVLLTKVPKKFSL